MKVNGDVLKYGDNIDTDVIIPARYLNTSVPEELAKHCMEDLDVDFLKKLKKGDILVGGKNFGCGSSREHAPICIKAAGVSCVIAKSFARIFYRNSINIGFPILECEEAVNDAKTGDKLEVDFIEGKIVNLTLNKEYKAQPFPEFMLKIMKNEGLTNCVKDGLF
ncbi:3-isopropylmalate dehydratase small subunit [Clostridium felsineum]|uniref:3-isopropylmalate dehydratase small subunit n=1 Tax=Clostridium felsineum TaxID=36839 RepID=A0A1S8M8H9_9CLOT|nr:3-isopropylmalate dehydratase small subunit [Clostridium felsineum]MCR3758066.1 3-isopropylmalate dehydratase small subunit [Clostridium felsineum]URZ03420.1 2,3-dimethylmalate dehydratase small subunit [Clostridium felsineum]URZ08263.1 2,3-dimethylmalate dehydratase small subunit [Clostridium felsineum]URZ13294.1 2,3-dimethylmalate dehydratase small subunit [Clostridium felsineum]URZ14725.1 2,3-dimethylmalate dehydratase small subunit [Clostridium felsineum DSM 794]